ncbi:MAG: YlbF family regulator [Firmicutes bacterium]|nr:YlbF family regulator [Bacillota bacterium]
MTIYEKAKDLGESILETEQGKRASEARYVFDGDEEAQKMLSAFTSYRADIQMKVQNGELDEAQIAQESKKINDMAIEVQKNEVINELIKAERNLGVIVNEVFGILKSIVDGEEEGCGDGCGGGCCSSCGGCH